MFRLLNKCDSRNSKIYKHISAIKCCLICFRGKSYYHVLGLDSTASAKDIKSAYYKLSLQFHPDKNNGSPESVEKFREITEAYEVLSNLEKKKTYDQTGDGFQTTYSRNHSYRGNYYRPRGHGGPYTGSTKDFNYDEHFKKHYEEYEKNRQAEHEYFKRRWEAEFYRRYPNPEDYFRRRHEGPENFEGIQRNMARRRKSLIYILSIWGIIFLVQILSEFSNPNNRPKFNGPIYYEVKQNKVQDEPKE